MVGHIFQFDTTQINYFLIVKYTSSATLDLRVYFILSG